MKTKLLFFDMEFTALSPDAQLISLGIVSDCGKSLYCEFSDYDINRCDEWVKENVVGKLKMYGKQEDYIDETLQYSNYEVLSIMRGIRVHLANWITQFSDYQIQFVCDCGTYDWYWMVQLLAEWETTGNEQGFIGQCPTCSQEGILNYRTGLPKLPTNISPVPEDLNDLIARVKGISVREAFDLNREEMVKEKLTCKYIQSGQHNALFDADVIKEIYQKLK